jgi:serine/threonine protein kinase
VPNSPARSTIDVGAVIDGTYTIEGLIGRGGMGAVFVARHNRLAGKKVAIKMLHAELADGATNDEVLKRFKREADIASQLEHPNIVKVFDYKALDDGSPYIVYEYLEGESLAQRLRAGPLGLEHALSIMRQVGSALAAAHRAGIVHRDLKPQNIFLVPSETDGHATELAKVLDFGISKLRGSQTVKTQDSALLGTPQYMAPEQATGQHSAVDGRTDVFALGAILYEMLAGQPAFNGASIPEVVFKVVYEPPAPLATLAPTAPAPIVAAVERAMAKAPADRFATMGDFVEALTGTALTSGIRRPPSSLPPSDRHSSASGAFAQTMGSGDHGESPIATPPPVAPVRGSAPTVDSQSKPADRQSAATTPAIKRVESRTRWSPALIVGLVLGTGALAAGIVYVAMRDRGGHERRDRVAERHEQRRDELVKDASEVSKPKLADAGSAAPVHAGSAAKPPEDKAKPDKPKDKPPPLIRPETAETGDEPTAQILRDAEAAMKTKTWDRVETLANKIISGETASPSQKAHAHVLHGIAACAAHNSDELAHIDLRQLDGFPRMHRRLVQACQDEGHLKADRP